MTLLVFKEHLEKHSNNEGGHQKVAKSFCSKNTLKNILRDYEMDQPEIQLIASAASVLLCECHSLA